MIEFRCRSYDRTLTPIVRNEDVRAYAEAIAGDCDPKHLREPGTLSFSRLIEGYLGARLEYQDLYYDEGESPIAGATVFDDGRVLVFDREALCVKAIAVPAGTIILDSSLAASGCEAFSQFTALHEAGHFCMHPAAYRRAASAGPESGAVSCCRKTDIVCLRGGRSRKLSPARMREHQANVFAAYAAMPRQTFVPYARELIRGLGCEDGVYVYDDMGICSAGDSGLRKLVSTLAETYGVSYTAAQIHLSELNLLIPFSDIFEMSDIG